MCDVVPIIVGITGHRDVLPQNKNVLVNEICNIFYELKNNYRNTPIVLLSPLAEGADRIAAEAALSSGIKYMVPLPFEKEEYEKDFNTEESKSEFNMLLSTATTSFVPQGISKDIPREKYYEAVGVYIVKHCHILIALWDGKKANGVGGTAQIVSFCLNGIPKEYRSHKSQVHYADGGVVYHILTPRIRNKDIKTDFKRRKLYAEFWNDTGNAEEEHNKIFKQIDEFNEDIKKYSDILKLKIEKSREHIEGSNTKISANAKEFLKIFALADVLSLHFQSKRQDILKINLILSGIIVSSFLLYDELWQTPILLLTYIVALFAAYFGVYRNRTKKYENKYLDYRALAEGLRIQFFWRMVGIHEDVSDYYLNVQKSEMKWIKNSIQSVNMFEENKVESYKDHEFLLENWLKDQYNFYSGTSNKNFIKRNKLDKVVTVLFIFNVIIICLMLYSEVYNARILEINLITTVWENRSVNVAILGLAKILTGLSCAIISITRNYGDRMALGEQCKRYYKMKHLFGGTIKLVERALEKNDLELSKGLIKELGVEALKENWDWMLLFRERPIEAPK